MEYVIRFRGRTIRAEINNKALDIEVSRIVGSKEEQVSALYFYGGSGTNLDPYKFANEWVGGGKRAITVWVHKAVK